MTTLETTILSLMTTEWQRGYTTVSHLFKAYNRSAIARTLDALRVKGLLEYKEESDGFYYRLPQSAQAEQEDTDA